MGKPSIRDLTAQKRRDETEPRAPQALAELRRVVDLEVDVEHRDADREPPDVVVAGAEAARALVDRLDVPPYQGMRFAISSAGACRVTSAS